MAIYNVKIVDDAGASTTQPIGASSDNVLIQDENISLTQKLENINADRDALLDQIKKVESRHFTINKHIDSTNVPTDDGFYKIAKLPDGETFANGTEWLINVTENITQIAPFSEEENISMSVFVTSKIIFKDGKFTLISFDNKLQVDAPDDIKESIRIPESREVSLLREINYDNNSFYLYGESYSSVFENAPSSFVDIGVTFLELSNAQDCFLEGVNFEFIPESEFERDNILNYQYLDSNNIETDTKTSFTINNYEDEVLESGWYKIAYYDYGSPYGECILSLQSYTDETGTQTSSFLLTIGADAKITPISQILNDGINIDQIRVINNNGNTYILIHLNLGEYESLNWWDCCVTVHNINYQQYIDDGEETLLWVAPREPFSKIIEDEIDDIDIDYNITNDPLIYPLTNIGGGGGGASTAAQVSYNDTVSTPFGADNVQDALDNLKGILGSFNDFVNSKTSESLNNSKAYTDTEVAEALAEAKAYTDENSGGGTADNALALDGHPASYFATNTQLSNALDEAKAYAESLFDEYINGES